MRLVKIDGTTLELRGAKVVGDSIKGLDAFGNADIAVASSDVRVVATRHLDGPRTALAVTGGFLAIIGGWFLLLLTSGEFLAPPSESPPSPMSYPPCVPRIPDPS